MQSLMREKANTLLRAGKVSRVLGWQKGLLPGEREVAVFRSIGEIDALTYDPCCIQNLCKFLMTESRRDGKLLVFLRPCDAAGGELLCKENRIVRENLYIVGIPCNGVLENSVVESAISFSFDGESVTVNNETKPLVEACAETCLTCCHGKNGIFDEVLGDIPARPAVKERFAQVRVVEAMTSGERFAFWQGELSRCIRCNACRNACPVCNCRECVFDNTDSCVAHKGAADHFEENLFHIIRAFHVSGRCTDCGLCSRVCPEHIPLHLLNRKMISDGEALYGSAAGTLTAFSTEDGEPNAYAPKGGKD